MSNLTVALHPAWLAAEIVTAFIVGACAGLAHFGLLWRMATLFVAGGPTIRLGALYILRFLGTGALLYLAARAGALPLLAALAGILAARRLVIRGGAP